ncbi:sugar ABC transporter ATP-binding protein [Gordonia sp. NPDC003376]
MTVVMRSITKRYGRVVALDGVGVGIGDGEIVAVAGENGSGKSTLMKVLAGVVSADGGTIEIDGTPVRWRNPLDAARSGIALVPQEPALFDELRVYENVTTPLLRGAACMVMGRRRLVDRCRAAFERLGITDIDPMATLGSLSVADQSRTALAQALVTAPRVLILDESTSRLGAADAEAMLGSVRALRDQGMSVVIITHRISEMTSTADRVTVLRDGTHVGDLDAAGLTEAELVRMMVGRDIAARIGSASEPGAVVLDVDGLVVQGTTEPVSLTLRAGETVGLAGLVGAGRTELLETLAGARRRIGGTVAVAGIPVGTGIGNARRAGIGLVPEDRGAQGLVRSASVHENHTLGSLHWHAPVRHRTMHDRTRSAIASFGVKTDDIHVPVSALSGGNQQKVVVSRVLAQDPRILLLDEPSRGIDVGAREEIYTIIGRQAALGMGVLVASSEIAELLAVCDRVLVMRDRRIVGDLCGDDLTEDNIGRLSAGMRETIDVG